MCLCRRLSLRLSQSLQTHKLTSSARCLGIVSAVIMMEIGYRLWLNWTSSFFPLLDKQQVHLFVMRHGCVTLVPVVQSGTIRCQTSQTRLNYGVAPFSHMLMLMLATCDSDVRKRPIPHVFFSIPITGQTGAIRDLTWEEQSGLICILVCRRNGEGHGIET